MCFRLSFDHLEVSSETRAREAIEGGEQQFDEKRYLDVLNTVGCGDVFAGVFAAYHVMGSSLEQSLIMASAAAGLNATRPETRGSPDRANLEEAANRSRKLGFASRERKLL